ncbi:MAG: Wadjet anti-phage system protein JetD domain-containing protein, partial [Oscillospiraceae bacterium]
REMKSFVITVIKNNEPDLKDIDDISDREALAQVGIIMMSEVFEFCGNVRINFEGGTVDYSPIKNGVCVLDESVSEIESIDIFDTDRIIFIENKTNYSEYCLNSRTERELVVYHGGFYSPKRGEFFRKLCDGKDIRAYLWSDIDYGGFRMYIRLKKNIVPSLEPLNMDIDSFERYKEKGLKRDEKYIITLQKLTEEPDYSVFYDVIAAISDSKVTVEQESFLENELMLN